MVMEEKKSPLIMTSGTGQDPRTSPGFVLFFFIPKKIFFIYNLNEKLEDTRTSCPPGPDVRTRGL